MTEFPVMKGNANMARGASYFEVPLFSHVIGNLWQGCSPAEFPDQLESYPFWTPTREPVKCRWLWEKGWDFDENGDSAPDRLVPRFDKILNLYQWGVYEVPAGTEQLTVEMYDGLHAASDQIEELAEQVILWLEDGNKVLVHCQAGLNRSSVVVARVLMKKYDMTADEAIAHIRKSRSDMCLCNDTFRQWLKGLR